ncbi:MAG: hypothetical protein NTV88_00645, partial [Candidatus Micrarchaeota archaeon]|nr:hypothetical protein [Candidatus Micrarchaeota archaeon]
MTHGFKNKILNVTGEGNGIMRHGFSTQLTNVELKQLKRLHDKHIGDYAKIIDNDMEYRKRHFGYRKAAKEEGISINDADSYHKVAIYRIEKANHKDCTGGQFISCAVYCDPRDSALHNMLAMGTQYVDENKVLRNGVFGLLVELGDETARFSTASFYINNHNIEHGERALLFEMYVASYGQLEKELGYTEQQVVDFWREQRARVIKRKRDAGFDISKTEAGTPYQEIYNEKTDCFEKTYFPLVFHGKEKCELYVLEGGEKVPLNEWYKQVKLYEEFEVIRKYSEKFGAHRGEAGYYDGYTMQNEESSTTVLCCDSRHQRKGRATVKVMGGILTEHEKMLELCNPKKVQIVNCLHIGCGYVGVAYLMHTMGMELEAMFNEAHRLGSADAERIESARKFFKSGIRRVEKGTWQGFDLKKFMLSLESMAGRKFSVKTNGLLDELLKSHLSDTRNSVQDMLDKEKRFLVWDEKIGTVAMPAALELDRMLGPDSHLLPKNWKAGKEVVLEKEFMKLLTLTAAKQETDKWIALMNERHDEILAKRIENAKKIGIEIDYKV